MVRSAAILVFAGLLCALSHGFAVTRSLIAIARDIRTRPLTGFGYDWRGDRLFAYVAPTLLALDGSGCWLQWAAFRCASADGAIGRSSHSRQLPFWFLPWCGSEWRAAASTFHRRAGAWGPAS